MMSDEQMDLDRFEEFLSVNNAPFQRFIMHSAFTMVNGKRYTAEAAIVSRAYLPEKRILTDAAKFLATRKTKLPIGIFKLEAANDSDNVTLYYALGVD